MTTRSTVSQRRARVVSSVKPTGKNERLRPATLRVSVAKDRTVKRLLYELVRLAERTHRRDVVKLTLRLHSVLAEVGHDV